jgi:RHS repeat-associated protein
MDPGSGQYLFSSTGAGRDYDPTLGRWDEQDRSGYADGMNLYQMEGSDPVNRVDPTGLDDMWAPGARGGTIPSTQPSSGLGGSEDFKLYYDPWSRSWKIGDPRDVFRHPSTCPTNPASGGPAGGGPNGSSGLKKIAKTGGKIVVSRTASCIITDAVELRKACSAFFWILLNPSPIAPNHDSHDPWPTTQPTGPVRR